MRGFLRFIVLRLVSKQPMSGEDLRKELEKRKGQRPSPGTIYPVLKTLTEHNLIEITEGSGKEKKYSITEDGKKELEAATRKFVSMFSCMKDEFNSRL